MTTVQPLFAHPSQRVDNLEHIRLLLYLRAEAQRASKVETSTLPSFNAGASCSQNPTLNVRSSGLPEARKTATCVPLVWDPGSRGRRQCRLSAHVRTCACAVEGVWVLCVEGLSVFACLLACSSPFAWNLVRVFCVLLSATPLRCEKKKETIRVFLRRGFL